MPLRDLNFCRWRHQAKLSRPEAKYFLLQTSHILCAFDYTNQWIYMTNNVMECISSQIYYLTAHGHLYIAVVTSQFFSERFQLRYGYSFTLSLFKGLSGKLFELSLQLNTIWSNSFTYVEFTVLKLSLVHHPPRQNFKQLLNSLKSKPVGSAFGLVPPQPKSGVHFQTINYQQKPP